MLVKQPAIHINREWPDFISWAFSLLTNILRLMTEQEELFHQIAKDLPDVVRRKNVWCTLY